MSVISALNSGRNQVCCADLCKAASSVDEVREELEGVKFPSKQASGSRLGKDLQARLSDTKAPGNESILVALKAVLEQLQRLILTFADDDRSDDSAELPSKEVVRPSDSDALKVQTDSKQVQGISNKKPGQPPDDIWMGLMEGNGLNAGYIACIKAAMLKFGQSPLGIYTSVTEKDGVYEVVMRDGNRASLSKADLEKAALFADFRGTDESMIEDATFIYAVAAKRMQHDKSSKSVPNAFSKEPYECALQLLTNYFRAYRAFPNLGLGAYMRETTPKELVASGGIGLIDDTLLAGGHLDVYGPEKYTSDNTESRVTALI